ncbi:MAG TPA: extracellular solute-binding protein [Xanthobacteraceae bacterium]|jgi:putative spermidine/putrescine transport system substrate-binding protein|nr:extracellular solute-binding protein [Xanthobacteraceae bacterium]
MITRRHFGKGVLAGVPGLLALATKWESFAADGQLVATWSPGASGANFKKSFADTFKQAEVRIIGQYDGPRLTQMQANRSSPTVDIAVFTNVTTPLVMRSDLISPLDVKKIPNLSKVDPKTAFSNHLGAPVTYGCWGILYNAERVKTPIESWGDLLRADLKGHVSTANVTYSSSLCTVDALARLHGGSVKSPERGLEMIRQIRLSGPGLWDQDNIAFGWLKTGELWATPCNSAQLQHLLRDPDIPKLKFVAPKEGGYYLGFNVVKVANAPHPDLADQFINHMLDAQWQALLPKVGNTRPTNVDVAVPPAVAELVPPAANLHDLDWDYLAKNRRQLTNEWDRIVNA